jgi:hypothetical protein
MRRFALLTYICLGLTVIVSAGCHKWHHKCFTRACCNVCEPCGRGEVISGAVEGVPIQSSVILPGPPIKGVPAVPSTVSPQTPGVRISTPQG